jgi:PAS domain S-box-containing protein
LPLSLGLYALCAASLAGACLYFFFAYVPGRRAAVIKAWEQELVVRADLRKMTLDHWVAVGMADAEILAAYPPPRAAIPDGEGTLTASRAADAAAHLREVAERFARMRGYHRFVLLDTNLRIVVGVGAAAQLERPDLQGAAEVLAQGKTIVDFHRYADGRVAVVFLARVGADTASRTGGGVVLLEADPSKWLYPYLAMRPMAAGSAETVLMQADGDDIVFLSHLRHNPAPPLTFRRPANVMGFAALAAVEGHEGFGAFVDYRNEPVFAAVAKLDGAPWGIVVKVDEREALATYRQEIRRTGATAAFAFLGFWAAAFMLVFAWRWRAEAALRESEERYRATLYSIGDAVIATDQHGRVKQMNPVAARLTGWTEAEAQGRPLDEVFRIVNEETHAVVESPVARVLREGQVVGLANHSLLIGKDGKERPIADSGAPIRNEKGETTGVVLVFRDQTEERAAQKALKESEAFNRTIVESIPQQLFLKDRNGVYLAANQPYAASLGCRPEQLVGKDDFAFYPTEVTEKYRADDRAVMESGQVKDMEERYLAQGKEYWVHTIKAPVRDDGGQVTAVLGLFEDISARKRVEQSLKDARDRLEEAQRAAHLGNWEFDALNDQITGSQEFYRLFDVVPEGLSRFSQFVERLHPDDRERVQRDVADALKQDRPYDTDYRVRLSDGGRRDIIARGRVFVDEEGKPVRMVGTCLDITERKRAEEKIARLNSELEAKVVERTSELKDEMELTQKIVNASPVGVFACRSDGPCVLANPAIARISGAPVEKLLQLNFHELPEWKKSGLHDKAQAALATGVDQHAEIHLTTSFGRDAWLSYTFTTFERGGVPHFLMLVDEITARKQAEAALRASEELSRTTLYSIGDGVIATDAAGLVARMNPVAELLTGWSEAEASGRPVARVFHIINEETRAEVENPVEHALREGKAVGLANHTLLIARDGTERPIADSGAPIRNEKGEVTGVVLVFRDRTDERAAQKALHEHAAQLQESNKELEAFSYSVSHDLRAPLRAIDGFTRLLSDDYAPHLNTEGKRICSVIHENTGKMSRLIDDLLAFSRLGRAEMSLSPIDMETMANSVFHELTTPESLARIDFQVGVLPPAVADPTLMRQVWMNLLANAIKFSSKRERAVIKVSAQQNQGESVYVVQDNGAGFEMQYVGKLFGVFQRLHSSKEFEGTGVGLALVQRVIRRHGGRVWGEGEIDKGATFYFALQQRGA